MRQHPCRRIDCNSLAGKNIVETNPYQPPSDDSPTIVGAAPKYTRSRFGKLLAALGMFGHMVLMVPTGIGWLVCLRPVLGLQLRNTPSPSTPLDWCVSGMMCVLSLHAAHLVHAETKTFETFTLPQERFRSISMTVLSIAPIFLSSLTLDPYPTITFPSAPTFTATILLSLCWLGLAWLRFRQMNSAKMAS